MAPKVATKTRDASDSPRTGEFGAGEIQVREWQSPPLATRVRKALSFRNMSALYLFVVLFVAFAIWVPSTFLTASTWRSLISDQAITCLVALGAVPALAAGVFELAIGSEVGLGAVLVAWLLADRHVPVPLAIALTVVASVLVGVINWVLIARARVPSFIATLGMSSVLTAVILWLSGGAQILNLPASFERIANHQILGLQLPVFVMLAIAILVWYVLERTPAGRGVYAAGADPDAAALAGVRVSRVILCAAVACAVIGGVAGLLESSQLSTGDPTIGPGYLLPGIAAVFLGSTQFRGGRMNVWGTVVAAYVIATGVKGLQLAGAPTWIPDLFNGAALLVAVGLAAHQKSPVSPTAAIRRLLRSATRSVRSSRRARRAEQLARVRSGAGDLEVAGGGKVAWTPPTVAARMLRRLSIRNIGALYLLAFIVVVFSLWVPATFLTSGTWRSLISDQAITCLAAVALVPVIAAGVVDLAIGAEVGLGGILVAWLLADRHLTVPMAIGVTLLCAVAVGLINWALIVRGRIPPFIATLGMSSVLVAVIAWVSGGTQILDLPAGFQKIGNHQILGLQLPVYILLVIAVITWYVVERTPAGRHLYATGANPAAARLAGIRTSRVILLATIACAVIAAVAGLLESAQLGTGDPTVGPGYLLPTIAAVFLGSTQFKNGRMNVWGTVVGAYVIATGVKGLQLAGAPTWSPELFDGVILIAVVALAQYQRRPSAWAARIRKLIRRDRAGQTPERAQPGFKATKGG